MSSIKITILPITIIALIGIWAMPEREAFLENNVRAVLYIFLGFWMVWPPYLSLIRLPGDPWMSPQRLIIYILLVLALIMFSVSKKAKNTLYKNYSDNRGMFRALLLLIFASFISTIFAKHSDISSNEFIKALVFNYLVFFLAATLLSTKKHLRIIFSICIAFALILASMSFYEVTLSQTIWSHHIPSNLFANSEDVQRILTPKFRDGMFRVKVSSLTSLEYAELLSYVLPMCLYYLFENKGKTMKIVMAITILAIFYAIVVSRSRLGLVGAIVSISNYSYLLTLRLKYINKGSLLGPALLTLYPAGLATLGILITSSTTLSNMILGGGGQTSSTNARYEMWERGIPLIAKQPILGYGLANGAGVLNYRTPSGFLSIDTYILQVFLDTGLIGGFAFIFLFALGIIKTSRIYINSSDDDEYGKMSAALASIFITFLIIKIVLSQAYNHTLLFLLLGIATHYRLKSLVVK